ncbi:unnamed protein product [Onchocerca ochengi]|uniref:Uncharacterized protein n=1 Tax=Onchocerca ochengi TaxID=42157 RepID=A0A182EP00_ONCOC|nr:unnamed protein product [Onchocerca ochengi]
MEQIREGNSTVFRRQSEGNSSRNIGGGWYNTRRQYRSVAFGTWKVGDARELSLRRCVSENEGQVIRRLSNNLLY